MVVGTWWDVIFGHVLLLLDAKMDEAYAEQFFEFCFITLFGAITLLHLGSEARFEVVPILILEGVRRVDGARLLVLWLGRLVAAIVFVYGIAVRVLLGSGHFVARAEERVGLGMLRAGLWF